MTRLAASQYAIELIETWEAYTAHLSAVVREAKSEGAELLLLPEYSAMTLTGQLPPDIRSDLHRSIEEIQPMIPSWVELCEELARQHQILFQPGSAPVKDPDGKFRNRVAFRSGWPNRLSGQADHDPLRTGAMEHPCRRRGP